MCRRSITFLSVPALVLSAMLAGCGDLSSPAGPISKALRKETHERKQTTIELARFTPFPWDELYLFGPYAPREEFCRKAGISDLKCRAAMPGETVAEGETLLLFRERGQVIHLEPHLRVNGDFLPLDYPQPLTPAAAVFVAEPGGKTASGDTGYRLRPRKP
jgi:hypothetical protein